MNLTKTDSQGLTTRPTHQTSRNLTENEHDCLFKLFEPDTVVRKTFSNKLTTKSFHCLDISYCCCSDSLWNEWCLEKTRLWCSVFC